MNFWEAFRKIFSIKLPDNIHLHFSFINITRDDHSEKIETNNSTKSININITKLDAQEKEKLKESLPLAVEEGFLILEKDSKVLMEDFKIKDADNKGILEFLKPKIPPEDLNIWRAALYMRTYFKAGDQDKTKKLKCDIMLKYGDKGKNIANLCSAGYLEDFLMPFFGSLIEEYKEQNLAIERFRKRYNIIVNELPFSIFVNYQMKSDDIKEQVGIKKKYGFKFLNIHGIGPDNVKKIKEVIEFLEKSKDCNIKKDIREESNIIFAKISFI
jgi:hypothetical protein